MAGNGPRAYPGCICQDSSVRALWTHRRCGETGAGVVCRVPTRTVCGCRAPLGARSGLRSRRSRAYASRGCRCRAAPLGGQPRHGRAHPGTCPVQDGSKKRRICMRIRRKMFIVLERGGVRLRVRPASCHRVDSHSGDTPILDCTVPRYKSDDCADAVAYVDAQLRMPSYRSAPRAYRTRRPDRDRDRACGQA